jgi:hypothetical protein
MNTAPAVSEHDHTDYSLTVLMSTMDRNPISSSLLASVGYDPDEQVLEVELQDSKVYQYRDVPEETYRGLLNADSCGRYFNHHIRGHSHVRVR